MIFLIRYKSKKIIKKRLVKEQMIYITGDKHGDMEFVREFCESHPGISRNDVLIILGDAGINYDLNHQERKVKKMLSKLPVTLLCVHGNHEERPRNIQSYKEVPYFDGIVYQERKHPNILFCKDGENYRIGSRHFFVLGGAYSTDKYLRLEKGWKWFASEQPSPDDRINAGNSIGQYEHHFDIVLSHTCPRKYLGEKLKHVYRDKHVIDYSTEDWLDEIEDQIMFDHWYFGHFHQDRDINDKATVVYDKVIEII